MHVTRRTSAEAVELDHLASCIAIKVVDPLRSAAYTAGQQQASGDSNNDNHSDIDTCGSSTAVVSDHVFFFIRNQEQSPEGEQKDNYLGIETRMEKKEKLEQKCIIIVNTAPSFRQKPRRKPACHFKDKSACSSSSLMPPRSLSAQYHWSSSQASASCGNRDNTTLLVFRVGPSGPHIRDGTILFRTMKCQ